MSDLDDVIRAYEGNGSVWPYNVRPNEEIVNLRSTCETCRHCLVWVNHSKRGCYAHACQSFIDNMGEGCPLWKCRETKIR